ncbi:GATOR complex protein NPRL2-like [Mytilus californianus]|uniref:GATOR complex protein NPRL2-like n=1 Tax=Mytilus californianus TaxID=6549 RepID=UPI002247E2BD|nr:GATOR complex protein NPRL2-like [Mytilus californianus]
MIKGMCLAEFHPTAGPKIKYQIPEEVFSKEDFDAIHPYIITKPDLKERLITLNTLGKKVIGCPVIIENPKYARNAYIFNLFFVMDSKTETTKYEPVVKKLASYLKQIESENEALSQEHNRENILQFLGTLMHQLNKYGYCSIRMGESCTVHLKVAPKIYDPPPVQDQDVPVFLKDKQNLKLGHWDLTTQQILSYIDGFKHVAKIAGEADVEINLVKSCLQNLVHYQVIKVIPIFQYSNVYTTRPDIQTLYTNKRLQEECIKYVAKKGSLQPPNFRDIFLLYCSLGPGVTVKDICSRFNPHALKIDERKLIQFGLMKGLVRRLQKYPIKFPGDVMTSVKLQQLYPWFNGRHSYDEICSKTGLSHQDLEEKIETDPSIVISWK